MRRCLLMPIVLLLAVAAEAGADQVLFLTDLSEQYLIIANNRLNTIYADGGTDSNTSNFELGANKAPVPSTDKFLFSTQGATGDPGTGGPTLAGAVPAIPANAAPILQGIGGRGNIAVTDTTGEFALQNTGVYGEIGIRVAAPYDASSKGSNINKSSNSFFNDPNQFPNTFDTTTQQGVVVNAETDDNPDTLNADQSTRIDAPDKGVNAGVTFGYDHAPLLAELAAVRAAVNSLTATQMLVLNDGKIENTTFTVSLTPGLNVIDIDTNGHDFLINNANFLIDGPADSLAIFRLPENYNMLVANSNILVTDSGIGMHSAMFYTDQTQNDTHFDFDNVIINHVAFWSLSLAGGTIDIDNAQGCTQLVADSINLSDVRFNGCGFSGTIIPTPSAAGMGLVLCMAALAPARRRRRPRAA